MSLKKVPIFLLFTIVMLIISPASIYANAKTVIINTDHLNVRTGPGTNFEKVTQVHENETYPILEEQGDWIKIELPSGHGWIIRDYISVIDQTNDDELIEVDHSKSIKVVNDNTHIRSGPSIEENIIDFVERGTVLTILSEDDQWYKVSYKDQTGYVYRSILENEISFSDKFKDKTIVIDAGHGGRDIGAIGPEGNFEKDFTYLTTQKLSTELSFLGAEVILTRAQDDYVRLTSRPVLSNVNDTNTFLSIHYNSFPSQPSVTGIGTYYYDEYSKILASEIQKNLIKSTEAIDRDIVFDDLLVLRQNYKPAVLLELGFISNHEKEQLLLTDQYQNKLVNGIITGLSSYFTAQ